MISLTGKYIISYMSRREAFNAPLLVVVGESLGGKCERRFLCPRSSVKILFSQLPVVLWCGWAYKNEPDVDITFKEHPVWGRKDTCLKNSDHDV